MTELPGCAIAIAHGTDFVFERAFGVADLSSQAAMSPRYRLRVASHSKTFTAVAVMLLREHGRLRLDDPLGQHVPELPASLAAASIGQVLSHAAGVMRDGRDCAHWDDLAPFPDRKWLREELAMPPVLQPGERMKYSNLGYGLLGLVIEAVTGEPFQAWVRRDVLARAGLSETMPDFFTETCEPLATGYSGKLPFGRRATASRNPTNALSPAAGFLSTAGDLVRFYSQLDPAVPSSILSPASRREMTRRHCKVPGSSPELHYGLGLVAGSVEDRDYFGHTGGFYGFQSRTCSVPGLGVTICVLVNAVDGPAEAWVDGVVQILDRFEKAGPLTGMTADWSGRWWNGWGAVDLVALGETVLLAAPDSTTPFSDAPEIGVSSRDRGWIRKASGFGSFGEPVGRTRGSDGMPASVTIAGEKHVPEAALVQLTPAVLPATCSLVSRQPGPR
nr:serine hydrolase domain-containing protein [uncultured Lichenicoccus sp.]